MVRKHLMAFMENFLNKIFFFNSKRSSSCSLFFVHFKSFSWLVLMGLFLTRDIGIIEVLCSPTCQVMFPSPHSPSLPLPPHHSSLPPTRWRKSRRPGLMSLACHAYFPHKNCETEAPEILLYTREDVQA